MFRIHRDASRWGDKLLKSPLSPVKSLFDLYYLSFIVGIGKGHSPVFNPVDVTEFNKNVTAPFQPFKYVLTGLLLVSELTNSGLLLDKPTVKRLVSQLIDANSPTYLSEEAMDLMNRYAYGGFESIRELQPTAPEAHDFMLWYYEDLMAQIFVS